MPSAGLLCSLGQETRYDSHHPGLARLVRIPEQHGMVVRVHASRSVLDDTGRGLAGQTRRPLGQGQLAMGELNDPIRFPAGSDYGGPSGAGGKRKQRATETVVIAQKLKRGIGAKAARRQTRRTGPPQPETKALPIKSPRLPMPKPRKKSRKLQSAAARAASMANLAKARAARGI